MPNPEFIAIARAAVADAPPLTPEQLRELRELFRPVTPAPAIIK